MASNLITDITESQLQLNAELFKLNPDSFIANCNMKYMKADQPPPDELWELQCLPEGKCDIGCTALSVINLMAGSSFLLRMYDHEVTNVPGVRFEYFVATSNVGRPSVFYE